MNPKKMSRATFKPGSKVSVQSLQFAARPAASAADSAEEHGGAYFDDGEQRRQFLTELDLLRGENAISVDEQTQLVQEYERIEKETYDRLTEMTSEFERRSEADGQDSAREWLALETESFRRTLENAPDEVASKLSGA